MSISLLVNKNILRSNLDRFHLLNEEEFSDFLEACTYQEFARKEFVLHEGKTHRGIFFVIEGVIGLFEIKDGKEMYQNFFLQGGFANDLKSLTKGIASKKNLIALESTKTFYISREKLLALYEKSSSYEKMGRKLLEHILTEQSELSNVLQSLKPEERYRYLEVNQPQLLSKVPLTYLASYMGLARETLSRIRARN